jgi:hypothetical protein
MLFLNRRLRMPSATRWPGSGCWLCLGIEGRMNKANASLKKINSMDTERCVA